MSKILLVMLENEVTDVISLFIKRNFKVEIDLVSSVLSASGMIKDRKNSYDCILADEDYPLKAGTGLLRHISKLDRIIPLVTLVGSTIDTKAGFKQNDKVYAKITKKEVFKGLLTTLGSLLSKRMEIFFDPADERSYLSVGLKTLSYFNEINASIYVKLSERKYLKIFQPGDYFGKEDFQKYSQKNIHNFYIPIDEVDGYIEKSKVSMNSMQDLAFTTSPEAIAKLKDCVTDDESREVINEIAEALKKVENKALSYEEGFSVCKNTHQVIKKVSDKFGANHEVQLLTKATVILAISTIEKSPKIGQYFDKFDGREDNPLSGHSILLANISCNIAKLIGWSSNITYYKLTLAAFLHDITVPNEKMIPFRTIPELMLKAEEFTEAELKQYMVHTEEAAKLVREFKMIPPDVDFIVAHHHERADGTGFPARLHYADISPLGCVFIVAHDLVSYITSHNRKDNWNLVTFLNQHRLLYNNGLFKKIFTSLWNALTNSRQIV